MTWLRHPTLLPDEVVISILGYVCHNEEEWPEEEGTKDLIQAQLACRRFKKLAHEINCLVWPLRNKEEGLGLRAFVSHKSFSVQRLKVFVVEQNRKVPYHLVFTQSVLELLPKSITVFCTTSDDSCLEDGYVTFNLSVPDASNNILEYILLASRLESLSIESDFDRGQVFIDHLKLEAPSSTVKHLNLLEAIIETNVLNSLLGRCSKIKTLKAWMDGEGPKAEGAEDARFIISSETLTDLKLLNDESLTVEVEAPKLLNLVISNCSQLKLKTPALEEMMLIGIECLQRPLDFCQPCDRLQQLRVDECPRNCWTKWVVPILHKCPSITKLNLEFDGDKMKYLPVSRFLLQLPSNLRMLSIDGELLFCLRFSEPQACRALPDLKHLKIGPIKSFESYFQVRLLCEAMHKFQRLEVHIAGVRQRDSTDILAFFRKDFQTVKTLDIHFESEEASCS